MENRMTRVDGKTANGYNRNVMDCADTTLNKEGRGEAQDSELDVRLLQNKEDNSVTMMNARNSGVPWFGNACLKTVQVIKPDQSTHMLTGREPEDFAQGIYALMGGNMAAVEERSFHSYAEEWFEVFHEPRVSKRWAEECRILLNRHLYPFFGGMHLSEIDAKTVQRFLNERADLAHSTQKHMLCLLRQILENALEDGLIRSNPAASKRLVLSGKETIRKPLEADAALDVQRRLAELTPLQQRMVALPLFAGLRCGEAVGLQWKHIDLARRLIQIRQAVSFINNQPVLKGPKSKAGIRDVPIIDDLLPFLAEPGEPEQFVLGGGERPLTKRAYHYQWSKLTGQIPQLEAATSHALRHTFATVASTNTDIKTLQSILGHSKADITLNRYVHPQERLIAEAAQTLSGLYETASKNSPVYETGEHIGSC